jgi:hypothetical protein
MVRLNDGLNGRAHYLTALSPVECPLGCVECALLQGIEPVDIVDYGHDAISKSWKIWHPQHVPLDRHW